MTEKKNIKTSQNCIKRDVMLRENVTKENERKSDVTIMVCVTIAQTCVTLCKPTGIMFSPHIASQNSRGSIRSSLSRIPKGGPKSTAQQAKRSRISTCLSKARSKR
eukprot:7466975-Ditylum_brightwellii.AAC.1